MTLARSTGAATRVVGRAERKPAVVISAVVSVGSARFGVRVVISFFEASYAYRITLSIYYVSDREKICTHPKRNGEHGSNS